MTRFSLGAAATLAACAWSPALSASGFSTARFGGEHGHPTAGNPTVLYFNPGALTSVEGTRLFIDGSLALRWASYNHRPSANEMSGGAPEVPQPADAEYANYGEATLFNVFGGPALFFSHNFGIAAVGVGAFAPFAGQGKWDENPHFDENSRYSGAIDSQARWYSVSGSLRSVYLSAGGAVKLGKDSPLSLGAAANLISTAIETTRAKTASGTDDLGVEGRSYLEVDGIEFSFGLGLEYEAIKKQLWLGASYQSRPNVSGGMRLQGTSKNFYGADAPLTDVDYIQDLPDVYRLGTRFRPNEQLELRLFGDLTRWSSLVDQCVVKKGAKCEINPDGSAGGDKGVILDQPRDWQDAASVRGGVSLWPSKTAELFAGLGWDGNAVPDAVLEPALMDADDIDVAAGARLELSKGLNVALSYTHLFYLKRDNVGKSKLGSDYVGASGGPDAGGIYRHQVGVFNANLDIAF